MVFAMVLGVTGYAAHATFMHAGNPNGIGRAGIAMICGYGSEQSRVNPHRGQMILQ